MTAAVGKTFPAKIIRASGTTLFHIAARELGDAQLWERIAALNGLIDPWIYAETEIKIPQPTVGARRG